MSISKTDQTVIDLLMEQDALTVDEMIEALGVTATAIRQRLNRLLAGDYIERVVLSEGRGRPKHRYSLSEKGRRTAGNGQEDLAISLWKEVQQIEDEALKQRLIQGVVDRLAQKYRTEGTMEDRMQALSAMFADRNIPIRCSTTNDGLPIVEVNGCPYPDLAKENRQICDLEKAVLTRIVGAPVELCQCRHDGDQCCSFEGTSVAESSCSSESSSATNSATPVQLGELPSSSETKSTEVNSSIQFHQ